MELHSLLRCAGMVAAVLAVSPGSLAASFEGQIDVEWTQAGQVTVLQYTVNADFVRIEVTTTNWPNPVNILDRKTGALTLIYPHNRSFFRCPPARGAASGAVSPLAAFPPAFPPGTLAAGIVIPVPPGAGATWAANSTPVTEPAAALTPSLVAPAGIGTQAPPMVGVPGWMAMSAMPLAAMPGELFELEPTGATTNLLGFDCTQFQAKPRRETLEVWATEHFMPYQPYVRSQPPRFGPRGIVEQWPALLTRRGLFPLRTSLRLASGVEVFRFEVRSVAEKRLTPEDPSRFQPPHDYVEVQPLSF